MSRRTAETFEVSEVDDGSKNSKSLFRFFTLKTAGLSPRPVISTRVDPSPNRVCETQLYRLRPSEDPAIGILVENLRFHVAAFDDGGFELGQDIVQQVLEKGPLLAG